MVTVTTADTTTHCAIGMAAIAARQRVLTTLKPRNFAELTPAFLVKILFIPTLSTPRSCLL